MKKFKRQFLVLALTICFIDCNSQYFYSKQRDYNNWFRSIINETNSSNYLVLNSYFINSPNNNYAKSQILKLDSQGNLLDSIFIDYDFFPEKRMIESGGHYYVFGTAYHHTNIGSSSKVVIYKFTSNFNLVKKITIDSTYINFNDSIKSEYKAVKTIHKNGMLYLVSNRLYTYGTDTTTLYKFDSNLHKLKLIKYRGRSFDLSDGGNNLILSIAALPPANISGEVVELDTLFNILTRFSADSLTHLNYTTTNNQCAMDVKMSTRFSLNYIGNNKYILSGEGPILKNAICSNQISESITSIIKNNSTIVKTVITGNSPVSNLIFSTDLQELSSYKSGYVYTARQIKLRNGIPGIPDSIPRKIMVHKIDTSGNVRWVKYLGGDKFYFPTFTFGDSDGGVLIGGLYYDTLAPKIKYSAAGFIIKLDSLGNLVPFYTKINSLFVNDKTVKCFPNPALSSLSFDIPFEEDISLKIFNSLGQQTAVFVNYKNLSQLDVSELSSGVYVYQITTKSKNYSGKFVIAKD